MSVVTLTLTVHYRSSRGSKQTRWMLSNTISSSDFV